ncbi:hypothetical protein WBQ88_12680 [Sphingopyxis sp. CCNWLW253]|uniref:hypothetical protein n=1 Tax=unclassified Sphingopyxis TaxID=2614943 RepID=UPI003012CF15
MLSVILSLALAAASANAAENDTRANTAQAAKPAKPKKVCQKVEVTGSTVPKRVCRTVAEPVTPAPEASHADAAASAGGSTN